MEREQNMSMRRLISLALVRRFLRAQEGATAIEYAIIAGGVSIAIVTTITSLGSSAQDELLRQAARDALTLRVTAPAFHPLGISFAPSASASRCAAEPGLSGFCWRSCGAQPDSQTISNVARRRPSPSAKRSA